MKFVTIYFLYPNLEKIKFEFEVGKNLLEEARRVGLQIKANCDGNCSCKTCHVYVKEEFYIKFKELNEITEEETDILETSVYCKYNSRLLCQIYITKNMHGICFDVCEESFGIPHH